MKPVDDNLLDSLLRSAAQALAEANTEVGAAEEMNAASWPSWPTLSDYEAHVKAKRIFTPEELAQIHSNPRLTRILRLFEEQVRASVSASLLTALNQLRSWLRARFGNSALVPPLAEAKAQVGEASDLNAPVYPLLIEQPDGVVVGTGQGEYHVRTPISPTITVNGSLGCTILLPDPFAKNIEPGGEYCGEMLLVTLAPEAAEIAAVRLTSRRQYLNIPLPEYLRSRPEWAQIDPQRGLPFAFVLRLREALWNARTA